MNKFNYRTKLKFNLETELRKTNAGFIRLFFITLTLMLFLSSVSASVHNVSNYPVSNSNNRTSISTPRKALDKISTKSLMSEEQMLFKHGDYKKGTHNDQHGTDTIKTFLYTIQGQKLQSGDEITLSKFDNVVFHRFNYDDIGGDTYSAIKNINPNTKIFIYQYGPWVYTPDDEHSAVYLRSIGRYNDDRGHSMGNLNTDNPDLFLLDENSNRIHLNSYPDDYLLDFGSVKLIDYWLEATTKDIIGQPWQTDGIFLDVCTPLIFYYMSGLPVAYPTNLDWTVAMNGFIDSIVNNYSGINLVAVNYGSTEHEDGHRAWGMLDSISGKPYFVLEEGSFVTWYGSSPTANFFTKDQWELQLETLNEAKNFKAFYQSTMAFNPGESGTDNYQQSLTFWDAMWFALTSFKLGQHDNSYFGLQYNTNAGRYNNMTYFDEFDISLGSAISDYQIVTVNGYEIFYREFEDGYVYVNPNKASVTGIELPDFGRQLSHYNFLSDPSSLPIVNSINLLPHRGTIIMKAVLYPNRPTIVNFSIPSNSNSTTIAITTFIAVDNVGLTGYLLTESPTTPDVNDAGWQVSPPTSYTFSSQGTKTLYAWAKNAAGDISESVSAETSIINSTALGYTTIFDRITVNGLRFAMPVTFTENGYIISISMYHGPASQEVIYAVYDDADGLPGARLGITPITEASANEGWQTINLINPVPVPSGHTVWLAWVYHKTPDLRFEIGTPGRAASTFYWDNGNMPDPFGGATTTNSTQFSIYCNYVLDDPNDVPSHVVAENVTIFPNPASINVTIRFSSLPERGTIIEIRDITGKLLIQKRVASVAEVIDIQSQPTGIFLVEIISGNNRTVKKLIIK